MRNLYIIVAYFKHQEYILEKVPVPGNLIPLFEKYPDADVLHVCESKQQAECTIETWSAKPI